MLKNDSKTQKLSNFENVQTLPNASQWVGMDPNGSQHVRKPRKLTKTSKKPRENIEKLRDFFHKNLFY